LLYSKKFGFYFRFDLLSKSKSLDFWRHSRAMHLYQQGMNLVLVSEWLGHAHLETTQVYAHADTEHKRKAIAAATTPNNPLNAQFSPERFTVTDEDMLKRLTGLK